MTALYAEAKHRHELTARTGSQTGSLLKALEHRWTKLANWLEDLKHYREAIFELRSLSDRELDDIGIPRYRISEIAWRSVVDGRPADRD